MTRYRSDFECTACHAHIIWDDNAQTLTCKCGIYPYNFVNPREYHQIPLDNHQKTLQQLPNLEQE